jgi:hypothetical protein
MLTFGNAEYMTQGEARAALQVTRQTLYNQTNAGNLHPLRVDMRTSLYDAQEILGMAKSEKERAHAEAYLEALRLTAQRGRV